MSGTHRSRLPESERARLIYLLAAVVTASLAPAAAIVSAWLVVVPLVVAGLLGLLSWYCGLAEPQPPGRRSPPW